MAMNLRRSDTIRIDCSSSEDENEENKPAVNKRPPDSDSDSDGQINMKKRPIKRQRVTKSLASLMVPDESVDTGSSTGSSLYTNNKVLKKMKSQEILKTLKIDYEKENIFSKQEPKAQQTKQAMPADPKPDTPLAADTTGTSRSRSPTPPPEREFVHRRGNGRMGRGVKKAMTNLNRLNHRLQTGLLNLNDSKDDSILLDDSINSPESNEITLKVQSLRLGIQRIPMLKDESFQGIVEKMAALEKVPENQIVLYCDERVLENFETPKSVNLHVADIIGCYIQKCIEESTEDEECEDPDSLTIYIQSSHSRSKLQFYIKKYEPFAKIFHQYSAKEKLDIKSISFFFDGEKIVKTETPEDQDMEGEEVIDAVITKSA